MKNVTAQQLEAALSRCEIPRSPLDDFVMNRLEQIMQRYDDPATDLLKMLRAAYRAGVQDSQLRLEDVLRGTSVPEK